MAEHSSAPGATRRVVVVGGSMAGLLATRVLSDYFHQVILVERDTPPAQAGPRKGVPQARHAHALLARGYDILARFFPDLPQALQDGGATVMDAARDAHWWHYDGYKVRCESGLIGPFMSRPFLEHEVRLRVCALPNVTCLHATEAKGLLTTADRRHVTGVFIERRDAHPAPATLEADLVVDATGRGSRTPEWLEALGYERPPETTITVRAGYTSRLYRRRPTDLADAKAAYCLPTPPHQKRMGALFPIEGDRWLVSLGGWLDDHCPADETSFVEFARALPIPHIHRVVSRSEPLSDFAVHKFPSNLRRRYELLGRMPEGLIVIGDAMCSFNPIYGQGMTVSAIEAETLDACLADASARGVWRQLPGQFFARVSRAIDVPWTLAAGEDLHYPEVEGKRPRLGQALNRYMAHVHRLTRDDADVYRAFFRVMNLVSPPTALFRPRIAWRVMHDWMRSSSHVKEAVSRASPPARQWGTDSR
jgi:2-polyprenyl-6-methoxyphenol hydroxylase-like FAD-dependent oxidoreductase